ncbi:MAG: ABC transporter permease [Nitrososphaerales archaeon]
MGFGRFLVTKSVSYFFALIATVSILYIATAGIIQQVVASSARELSTEYRQQLLKSTGIHLTPSQIENLVNSFQANYLAQFGFNQPAPFKFAIQIFRLLSFNFGQSYDITWAGSKNVNVIIAGYLPNTILLFTTATLILIAVATIIGLLAAKSAGSGWDRLVPFIAVLHSSLPAWWLGFLLIAGLGYALNLLPTEGMTSIPPPTNPIFFDLNVGEHMILPILALLIVGVGGFAYVVRSLVISTMGEDFVLTARARGISESRLLFKHVFRTASPAIATQSILAVTASFGGALTTEIVFNWPGVGLLTYIAIFQNDLPVIIGIVFVLTVILLIGLFIGEFVYGYLDPRIRVGSG